MLVQVRERVSGVQGAPQGTCSHWAAKARGGCSEEWRGARRDGRAHPWGAGGGNFEGSGPLCSSATQSCLTPCNPMDCSTPGLPVPHHLPEFAQVHVHCTDDPSSQLILCHALLLPSIFSSIRVFPNESALRIKWPKYWSFSFSISPSNEYSGLISLSMDWLDLLVVQGTLKSLLQHHSSKASILQRSAFFTVHNRP